LRDLIHIRALQMCHLLRRSKAQQYAPYKALEPKNWLIFFTSAKKFNEFIVFKQCKNKNSLFHHRHPKYHPHFHFPFKALQNDQK
jgi:hypothetical protein